MENLWANGVPYWDDTYIEGNESAPRVPTITVYEAHSKGAVVVFPGGGYVGKA